VHRLPCGPAHRANVPRLSCFNPAFDILDHCPLPQAIESRSFSLAQSMKKSSEEAEHEGHHEQNPRCWQRKQKASDGQRV